MPDWARKIMQAPPATHFISLAQAILYHGAVITIIWPQCLTRLAIGSVFFGLVPSRFRKTIGTMV